MEIHVIDLPRDEPVVCWPINRSGKQYLRPKLVKAGDHIKYNMTRGPNTSLRVLDKQWVPGNLCYRFWVVRMPSMWVAYEKHVLLSRMYRGWIPFRDYAPRVYGDTAKLVRFEDARPTGHGHCAICGSLIDKNEPAMKLIFASHQRPGFCFNKTKMGGEWICKQTVHRDPNQCGVGTRLVNELFRIT